MVVASSLFAAVLAAATMASAHNHDGAHHHHKRANIVSQCKHDFSFTFDDGPYTWTSQTIDAFNARGAKATFYMNGYNWQCIYSDANVAAVRKAFESGHQIASHTWSHYRLEDAWVNGVLNKAKIDEEVMRLDEAFVKIIGVKPRYLRPPFGSINTQIADYIEQTHKKVVVLWDLDSGDTWSPPRNAQQLLDFYQDLAESAVASGQCPLPPHFTLAHDVQKPSIDSAPDSIDALHAAGYSLVTTAQCMDDNAYEYIGGYGTKDATWTCDGAWTPTVVTPQSSSSSSTRSSSTSSSTSTSSRSSSSSSSTATGNANSSSSSSTSTRSSSSTRISSTSTASAATSTPTCLRTYTSKSGDTCESIGTVHGMTAAQVQAANPTLRCNNIRASTRVCITTASNPAPKCAVTYISRSGDNCTKIEDKMGMSSGALLVANPSISCSRNISPNTSLCIPANTSQCSRWERTSTATTCTNFGNTYGVNSEVLAYWNPTLNCSNIKRNTSVCVSH